MTTLLVCRRRGCYNVFEPKQGQKYCCDACRQKAYRERRNPAMNYDEILYDIFCTYCGEKFCSSNRKRKYCSLAHKQAHYRERATLKQQEDAQFDSTAL